MITTKDLISDNTPYSTTRWAFVVCIRSGIFLAIGSLITTIVLSILGKNTDGLIGGAVALIGVIMGVPTTAKALQGFETKHDEIRTEEYDNEKEDIA